MALPKVKSHPLRNYSRNSRNSFGNINVPPSQAVLLFRTAPTKTEGEYKISVASDSSPNTWEQYKTSFQQLCVNLFLPCLRGGAKGGGVTSIRHQLNSNNMKKMKKYRCKKCKWVYDPEFGDIKGGIPANTAFDDLPADWVCPVCKAPKKQFEEVG